VVVGLTLTADFIYLSESRLPTYEYQCPEGHTFEKFQKMTDKPRAKCPVCGKMAVRKISGGAGLVFKGTGFYITDYGKDGKGPRKEPTAPAPESSTGKSDSADSSSTAKKEPGAKTGPAESTSSSSKKKKAAGE
jgi:putative FmdB family regulatory protein